MFGTAQIWEMSPKTWRKHHKNIKQQLKIHVINHQNLDVHDFIRLVISSSLFSKNCWLGLPNYLRVWVWRLPFKTFGRIERNKETSKLVQKDWMWQPGVTLFVSLSKTSFHEMATQTPPTFPSFEISNLHHPNQKINLSGLKAQTSSQNIRIHDRFNKNKSNDDLRHETKCDCKTLPNHGVFFLQ